MREMDDVIRTRRSVRGFLRDTEVPREVLLEALELAQHAPSNCNVQPWRVFLASRGCRDRLMRALAEAINRGDPPGGDDPIDTFSGDYHRLQVECARELYSSMTIERGDARARRRAMRRNYQFFDAPHVAIVCMARDFGRGVAIDVGVWLQTFMLALWSRGIASCAQASLRTYPNIIRAELGIPEELTILCGVSIGYEDVAVPANRARQRREPIAKNVVLLDE